MNTLENIMGILGITLFIMGVVTWIILRRLKSKSNRDFVSYCEDSRSRAELIEKEKEYVVVYVTGNFIIQKSELEEKNMNAMVKVDGIGMFIQYSINSFLELFNDFPKELDTEDSKITHGELAKDFLHFLNLLYQKHPTCIASPTFLKKEHFKILH